MLNILWPIIIIISILYALFTGNVQNVNNSLFESIDNAINLSITMLGTICFWNGIMKIAQNTSLIKYFTKLIDPLINYLFPEIKNYTEIKQEVSMNIVANMLGISNAATPIGLKAMKSLQKINDKKERISDSMAMFIVINTASLQLIPTTVIAIRNSLQSNKPTIIVLPVIIATFSALIAGIVATKIFIYIGKKREKRI